MEELHSTIPQNHLAFLDIKEKEASEVQKHSVFSIFSEIVFVLALVAIVAVFLSLIEGFLLSRDFSFEQLLGVRTAHASSLKGYEAMQVTSSGSGGGFSMKPGEEKLFRIGFQNTGNKDWVNEGRGYVSIYTYGPKYRDSLFEQSNWIESEQPAIMEEAEVGVGEVGYIIFKLKAPTKVGVYEETFKLAAEDIAWIPGGEFTINISVEETKAAAVKKITTSPMKTTAPKVVVAVDGYEAMLLLKSSKKIVARAGEVVSFTAGIKNTGTKSWVRRSVRLPGVSIAGTTPNFQHSSWVDTSTLVAKADAEVAPGALDLLTFQFQAPRTKGNHIVKFVLAADGVEVPGGEIEIPVEVTNEAPNAVASPVREGVQRANVIEEPILRIGLLTIDEETGGEAKITCNEDYEIRDGQGSLLGEMKAGEVVNTFYKKMRYWFNRGKGLEQSTYYLRFVPETDDAICTMTNFDRRRTRNAAYADNQFRNILEIRYSEAKDRTWLINELPVEKYLRGLAETSNYSHHEFKKTLITVARTYALYHYERATKHADEYFHMNAYADDQVYKGYEYELRHPKIGLSAEDTEGVVVTYENRTAITPYFSRSDGRTRDWNEVWGGSVAWLKSVPTPCDKGRTLWGHGVGMSASAALCMANDGETWDDILEYFYQGIELQKRW